MTKDSSSHNPLTQLYIAFGMLISFILMLVLNIASLFDSGYGSTAGDTFEETIMKNNTVRAATPYVTGFFTLGLGIPAFITHALPLIIAAGLFGIGFLVSIPIAIMENRAIKYQEQDAKYERIRQTYVNPEAKEPQSFNFRD